MNTSDAYQLYIPYARADRNYSEQTMGQVRGHFRRWLLPAFGHLDVSEITHPLITAMRTRIVDRRLSGNSHYGIVMTLKLFLKFCGVRLHQRCLDPSEIPLPRRPDPEVNVLTNEQLRQTDAAIPIHTFAGLRLKALFEILIGTGMRIGEALSLDRAPFEEGLREIRITGKGKKSRTVFFPESALVWLRRFLAVRVDTNPAVFVTTGSEPSRVARNDISKIFKKLRKDAGLTVPLTPHVLRHTYCTNLLNNGVDITLIRDLAGHTDIKTTAKYYLKVSPDALRSAAAKLNYAPAATA